MAQAQGVGFQGTACSADFFLLFFLFPVWYPPGLMAMGVWQFGGLDSSVVTMRCLDGV